MDNIYKEVILDYYRNPRNYGKVRNADFKQREENTFCGDWVEISGVTAKDKIKDVKFTGKGCVISQAAASMLTDFVKNKSRKEIKNLNAETLIKLMGITLMPTRLKCAELSLIALKKAVGT